MAVPVRSATVRANGEVNEHILAWISGWRL